MFKPPRKLKSLDQRIWIDEMIVNKAILPYGGMAGSFQPAMAIEKRLLNTPLQKADDTTIMLDGAARGAVIGELLVATINRRSLQ